MKKNLSKVQSVDRAQIIDLGNNKKAAFAVYNEEPPVDDTTGTGENEIVLTPREMALDDYIIERINETLGKRIESLEKRMGRIEKCPTIKSELDKVIEDEDRQKETEKQGSN